MRARPSTRPSWRPRSACCPTELHRVIADDRYVFGFPGLTRNFTYGIFGRPDGVRTAHGALLPIETNSHREVTRLDELELTFYWLLLETVRTRKDAPPLGYVIARVDGRPEIVEIPLKPKRFDEVLDTLAAIRKARRVGVAPRICGCPVYKSSEVRRGNSLRHHGRQGPVSHPRYRAPLRRPP